MSVQYDSLGDVLANLQSALEESRTARRRLEEMLSSQIESLWSDNAALRDELHESVTALSNRIEANRGT